MTVNFSYKMVGAISAFSPGLGLLPYLYRVFFTSPKISQQ